MNPDNLAISQDNRPYTDAEIPGAIQSILNDPLFPSIVKYIYPDQSLDQVKSFFSDISTVRDLQGKVMRRNMDRILRASQSTFDYRISPLLRRDRPYLFISNHRDITLDAMLLQCALYDEGYETSQIIFGSNLLSIPLMGVIGRANKMVSIERGGNPKEFFHSLAILSDYIRHTITCQHESVWIAQGNGRTKDGNDTTVPAIIKMFALSSRQPLSQALAALAPVPVSVSYEIEPCADQKAVELAKFRSEGRYVKEADEDYFSVLSGITKAKGRIHIEVGSPLTPEQLADCHDDPAAIAVLLDDAIRSNYLLHPSNFIASDLRSATTHHADRYTPAQKDRFLLGCLRFKAYVNTLSLSDQQRALAEQIYLDIYANPVANKKL
ncbi:MAG: 1-acyl-sn-glycerol-3-phosphate acyltransferase [Bacteroidales bacterium]|nr:1-acyl-sn-glycerol-3-phosphate acyltransferase [Bacteroidales bacterium]